MVRERSLRYAIAWAVAGLVGLCLVATVWRYVVHGPVPPALVASVVWAGPNGLQTKDSRGVMHPVPLRRRNGEPLSIEYPIFGANGSTIAYWSPEDHAFCIKDPTAPARWLPLAQHLPSGAGWRVAHCDGYDDGFILSAANEAGQRRVLAVSMKRGTVERVANALDARGTPGQSRLAAVTAMGRLEVGDLSVRQAVAGVETPPGDWDYDAARRLFCFRNGRMVTLVDESGHVVRRLGIPSAYAVHEVAMQSAFGQVLISVDKPFSAGSAVLAYSDDGKLLGRLLESNMPISSPVTLTADHLSALLKLN